MEANHPLRAWRTAKGLGQFEVGQLVGVSASQISQIENRGKGCSLEVAIKLSNLAGIPIESLVLRGEVAQ